VLITLCLWLGVFGRTLRDVLPSVFTILFFLHAGCYCAAVFASPIGTSVLGNGQIVWMYVLFSISISRPPWFGPVGMWTLDGVVSLSFLVHTLIYPHPSRRLRLLNIVFNVFNLVSSFAFHVLLAHQSRAAFGVKEELRALQEDLTAKYLELEAVLKQITSSAIASEMVERMQRFGARRTQPRESFLVDGSQLNPLASRDNATTATDVAFVLLDFASNATSSAAANAHRHLKDACEATSTASPHVAVEVIKATLTTAFVCAIPRGDMDSGAIDCMKCLMTFAATFAKSKDQFAPMVFRMLIHVGPLIGAVLGTSAISFEFYGGSVEHARAMMREVPWGRVAATERAWWMYTAVSRRGVGVIADDSEGMNMTLRMRVAGYPNCSLRLIGL
jgi:hypothetical protein